MAQRFLAVVVGLGLLVFVAAQDRAMGQAEKEVRAAVDAYVSAVVSGDVAARERLMEKGFTLTSYTGRVIPRDQIMEAAKSGDYRVAAIKVEEMKVRTFNDDCGVVTARVRFTEEFAGQRGEHHLQASLFWVKAGGHWQIAAEHATSVAE